MRRDLFDMFNIDPDETIALSKAFSEIREAAEAYEAELDGSYEEAAGRYRRLFESLNAASSIHASTIHRRWGLAHLLSDYHNGLECNLLKEEHHDLWKELYPGWKFVADGAVSEFSRSMPAPEALHSFRVPDGFRLVSEWRLTPAKHERVFRFGPVFRMTSGEHRVSFSVTPSKTWLDLGQEDRFYYREKQSMQPNFRPVSGTPCW